MILLRSRQRESTQLKTVMLAGKGFISLVC